MYPLENRRIQIKYKHKGEGFPGNQRIQIKYKYKEEQFPESLFSLSLKCIARNLHVICTASSEGYQLHDGIKLPSSICDPFFKIYQNGETISDYFTHLFKDVTKTELTSVNIHDSKITDDGLLYLLSHNLYDLTLTDCHNLSPKTYINIFKHAVKLQSLSIDNSVPINPFEMLKNGLIPMNNFCPPTSNLKHFVLRSIYKFLGCTLHSLLDLRVLDLSHCFDLGSFKLTQLNQLSCLHTLILFNVHRLPHFIETALNICTLESLIVLDISQIEQRQGVYKDGNKTLALIVNNLPNLMYLDISNTNLAGKGIAEHSLLYESLSGKKSDILGLESRVDNPLEFLGLYNTMHNACQRHDIPAKNISGDANEIQLFNAAVACMNKPELLQDVLDDFSYLLKNNRCIQIDQVLDIVLEALTRYVQDSEIQVSGNFTLYNIVKGRPFLLTNVTTKRILTKILTGIDSHKCNEEIMKYGCMVISHLRIQDVILEFNRIVQMLLQVISKSEFFCELQVTAIYFLFSMIPELNNKQKNQLVDFGFIERIIAIIKIGIRRRVWNYILKDVWIAVWNVTDKAPTNCKRFLDEFGMNCFSEFFTTFTDEYYPLLHILGVLGNVAEVKKLRSRLMQRRIIKMLSDHLFSTREGIEVSYNAARVIAYLASDGHEVWYVKNPKRCEVLDYMTEAMLNWNLDAQLELKYCSFKSILQLAQVRHTPQCAHWAAWALANLTKVCPEKCCSIVIAEGGLKIMSELLEDDQINQNTVINSLAQTVINQCMIFKENTVQTSQIDE